MFKIHLASNNYAMHKHQTDSKPG